MCCFSRQVDSVSGTQIFARSGEGGRQYLVYSMTLKARDELAMILPLPVRAHSGEKAVRFINLEGYPRFFDDLELGFPVAQGKSMTVTLGAPRQAPLEVVAVGSFEASFVPTVADFGRLDPRFRLPQETWDQLPSYGSYGFAVFKLKPGAKRIHPMAFEFPRADRARLFFPTVHIHDGRVHDTATFDHTLFCQRGSDDTFSLKSWDESSQLASSFMQVRKCQGVVLESEHCYRMSIAGRRKNADTWVV